MNREIEEMANNLAKICPDLVENCCGQVNCVTHLTLSLSKLGYRKSTDVAREIFAEIDEARERWESVYGIDHFGYGGDAYGYLQIDVNHTIYELRKKYESEGEE